MQERSIDPLPPHAPRQGSNPQPGYVPCPGIEPVAFWLQEASTN